MINTVFQSLQRRLVLIFGLALLVPFALGLWASFSRYQDALQAVRETAQNYAMLASNYEASVLWQTHQIADALIKNVSVLAVAQGSVDAADLMQCRSVMAQAITPFVDLGNATLFAANGTALCRGYEVLKEVDVSDKPWFLAAFASSSPSYSGHEISARLNEPVLLYTRPLANESGRTIALLAISIRMNWLLSVGQEPGLPPEAEVTLLDRNGAILVSSPADDEGVPTRLPDPELVQAIVEGRLRGFVAPGGDGIERIFAVNSLAQKSVFVVLALPWQSVISPIRLGLITQLAAITFVIFACMIAALVAGRILVTRWTDKLTRAAATVSLGKISMESELYGAPREIQILAKTLHDMAVQVEAREADLRLALDRERAGVREIHHRVKNNLQIVTSLISHYQRQLPDGGSDRGLSALQTRIRVLAMLQRHLYESENLKEIPLSPFMSSLCDFLGDGSVPGSDRLSISVQVPDIRMQNDCAIPLALLTTELIMQSISHFLASGQTGMIDVRLTIDEDCSGMLVVADNRSATSKEAIESPAESRAEGDFDSRLINAFARQIGGRREQSGPPDFRTMISFSIRKPGDLPAEI